VIAVADIRITPTRMELKKYRAKLVSARRGHKLLSDKKDEMIPRFLDIAREAKALRDSLSEGTAEGGFEEAAAYSDPASLNAALMLPAYRGELKVRSKNIMGVDVPVYEYTSGAASERGGYPYGFAFTSGALDDAVEKISSEASRLVHLAELESSALILCDEIERARRRVNALEYIMIPKYESICRQIQMKLDENERASRVRLMKVKDMMIEAQLSARKASEE
jgi:V/A-type H+-transporting ATPase subunit D